MDTHVVGKLGLVTSPSSINSVKVIELDNLSYNNELSYGSLSEWIGSLDAKCHFCNSSKATFQCQNCKRVRYCKAICMKKDLSRHNNFCNYFMQTHVERLHLIPRKYTPSNNLIPDRTKKMKLKDYIGKEFLVKISAGDNYFGFDEKLIQDHRKMNFYMLGGCHEHELLVIYDKFRFVCGTVKNVKLFDMVMQFGKLSGEQIYAKRIYINARIIGRNKNEIEVRTDELLHYQGW